MAKNSLIKKAPNAETKATDSGDKSAVGKKTLKGEDLGRKK